jgi:hypothetical protein
MHLSPLDGLLWRYAGDDQLPPLSRAACCSWLFHTGPEAIEPILRGFPFGGAWFPHAALRTAGTRRASLELHNRKVHLGGAIMPEEPIKSPSRLRVNWPAFPVGLGLVATLVWALFLGWLLGRVVRLIP